jgi:hypothetical protein
VEGGKREAERYRWGSPNFTKPKIYDVIVPMHLHSIPCMWVLMWRCGCWYRKGIIMWTELHLSYIFIFYKKIIYIRIFSIFL